MNKTIKLNGNFTKEQLQEKLKEFDKKTIEFKIYKESNWDYKLDLYIDGKFRWDMCFDKNSKLSYKLFQFNWLIETAIREYGGKDNFATQDDINNGATELWGIDLHNICAGYKLVVSSAFNTYTKYEYNCYSKTEKVIIDIAKALEPVADYIKKAFRGE